MPAERASVLELHAVTKRYGGLTALKDISFAVNQAEICGVIGPNGAGKSTLLGVISGSVIPTEGRVIHIGRDVTNVPVHKRARLGLARTFQLAHTFESMSVEDNILIGAEDHSAFNLLGAVTGIGGRASTARERARHIMELMGVADLAQMPASRLTFGQQRMVATGRAMAAAPELLLLDEPAAGLSGKDIDALAKAIRDIRDRGTAVVIVEHNMDVIMQLCDRIVVVHLGEKIGEGRPEEVRQSERVLEAYLGA